MELINFQDNVTKCNAETMNTFQNNIKDAVEKNIITATIDSNYTLTSTNYEKLNLSSSIIIGNKLTLENGSIVVGNGVNHVMINYHVHFQSLSSGLKWVVVYTGESDRINAPQNLTARGNVNRPNTLLEVTEGTIIDLKVLGSIDDNIRAGLKYTTITVEVID